MSLGTLAKLPGEIRRLIWAHFIYPRTPIPPSTSAEKNPAERTTEPRPPPPRRARRLAILESSKQIHAEVSAELDRDCHRHLFFNLYPDHERVLVGGTLAHLTLHEFRATDFGRFASVTVRVFAANDVRDAGQVLRLRGYVVKLVGLLGSSESVLEMDIVFRGSGWGKVEGGASRFLAEAVETTTIGRVEGHRFGSDIELVLEPFLALRGRAKGTSNTRVRRVRLPPAQVGESVRRLAECIETDTLYCSRSDAECRARIEFGTVLLDDELSRLRGPTAAILRRDRFQYWDEYSPSMDAMINRVQKYRWQAYGKFDGGLDWHSRDMDQDSGYFRDFPVHPFEEDFPGWAPAEPWDWWYPDGIPARETLDWDYEVRGSEFHFLTEEEDDRRRARRDSFLRLIEGD